MKASFHLPALLLLAGVCAAHAQIYKCREARGPLLYSDSPCGARAATVAVMPKGSLQFEPAPPPDAAVEAELRLLSEQERQLAADLAAAQSRPTPSPADAAERAALAMQIQAQIESVHRKKAELLGGGLAPEEGEELVVESADGE